MWKRQTLSIRGFFFFFFLHLEGQDGSFILLDEVDRIGHVHQKLGGHLIFRVSL